MHSKPNAATCGFGLCHEPATCLVIAPTAIGRRAELLRGGPVFAEMAA